MTDQRPDPNPRKLAELWQAYQWWHEIEELRKGHLLRISSSEKGKSDMSAQFERDMMERLQIDHILKETRKIMIGYGETAGPIWDWVTSIRGLAAGGEAAKLLAQIDDIGKFPTISKLWRFAGYAVIDGQIDRRTKGKKSPYNATLKAVLWRIVKLGFLCHRTPIYRDFYDEQYAADRRAHPDVVCSICGGTGEQRSQKWYCSQCGISNQGRKLTYTPGHIDARARRKTAKLFLSHLWVKWREFEGLPVSKPYIHTVGGHTGYVQPFEG
jgi:rubredoxin